jgi:hypothetical protein
MVVRATPNSCASVRVAGRRSPTLSAPLRISSRKPTQIWMLSP